MHTEYKKSQTDAIKKSMEVLITIGLRYVSTQFAQTTEVEVGHRAFGTLSEDSSSAKLYLLSYPNKNIVVQEWYWGNPMTYRILDWKIHQTRVEITQQNAALLCLIYLVTRLQV